MNLIFMLNVFIMTMVIADIDHREVHRNARGPIGTEIVCSPNNEKFIRQFIVASWNSARKLLSLKEEEVQKYVTDVTMKTSLDRYKALRKIFTYTPDAVLYSSKKGSNILIPYNRMWKCANEAIGHFFSAKNYWRAEASDEIQIQDIAAAFGQENTIKSFGYVRDPLDKFMSGFTEAVFRMAEELSKKTNLKASSLTMNVSETKRIIREFVDLKSPLNSGIVHMYPMSGTFFRFHFDIVGDLATFTTDWNNMIVPAYNITEKFSEIGGKHPTSMNHPSIRANPSLVARSDPNFARHSLSELLSQDIIVKQALCHFLLVDYVCLPKYPLPIECQHLNETRFAAEHNMREKQYVRS